MVGASRPAPAEFSALAFFLLDGVRRGSYDITLHSAILLRLVYLRFICTAA